MRWEFRDTWEQSLVVADGGEPKQMRSTPRPANDPEKVSRHRTGRGAHAGPWMSSWDEETGLGREGGQGSYSLWDSVREEQTSWCWLLSSRTAEVSWCPPWPLCRLCLPTRAESFRILATQHGEISLHLNSDPGKHVKKQDKKDQVIPTWLRIFK